MSHPIDLKPVAKVIDAMLPPGHSFVLIVMDTPTPERKAAGVMTNCQYVSPLPMPEAWTVLKNFVVHTHENPMFNPKKK